MIQHRLMINDKTIRTNILIQPNVSLFSTWIMSQYGFNSAAFRPVDMYFLELMGLAFDPESLNNSPATFVEEYHNHILNLHKTVSILHNLKVYQDKVYLTQLQDTDKKATLAYEKNSSIGPGSAENKSAGDMSVGNASSEVRQGAGETQSNDRRDRSLGKSLSKNLENRLQKLFGPRRSKDSDADTGSSINEDVKAGGLLEADTYAHMDSMALAVQVLSSKHRHFSMLSGKYKAMEDILSPASSVNSKTLYNPTFNRSAFTGEYLNLSFQHINGLSSSVLQQLQNLYMSQQLNASVLAYKHVENKSDKSFNEQSTVLAPFKKTNKMPHMSKMQINNWKNAALSYLQSLSSGQADGKDYYVPALSSETILYSNAKQIHLGQDHLNFNETVLSSDISTDLSSELNSTLSSKAVHLNTNTINTSRSNVLASNAKVLNAEVLKSNLFEAYDSPSERLNFLPNHYRVQTDWLPLHKTDIMLHHLPASNKAPAWMYLLESLKNRFALHSHTTNRLESGNWQNNNDSVTTENNSNSFRARQIANAEQEGDRHVLESALGDYDHNMPPMSQSALQAGYSNGAETIYSEMDNMTAQGVRSFYKTKLTEQFLLKSNMSGANHSETGRQKAGTENASQETAVLTTQMDMFSSALYTSFLQGLLERTGQPNNVFTQNVLKNIFSKSDIYALSGIRSVFDFAGPMTGPAGRPLYLTHQSRQLQNETRDQRLGEVLQRIYRNSTISKALDEAIVKDSGHLEKTLKQNVFSSHLNMTQKDLFFDGTRTEFLANTPYDKSLAGRMNGEQTHFHFTNDMRRSYSNSLITSGDYSYQAVSIKGKDYILNLIDQAFGSASENLYKVLNRYSATSSSLGSDNMFLEINGPASEHKHVTNSSINNAFFDLRQRGLAQYDSNNLNHLSVQTLSRPFITHTGNSRIQTIEPSFPSYKIENTLSKVQVEMDTPAERSLIQTGETIHTFMDVQVEIHNWLNSINDRLETKLHTLVTTLTSLEYSESSALSKNQNRKGKKKKSKHSKSAKSQKDLIAKLVKASKTDLETLVMTSMKQFLEEDVYQQLVAFAKEKHSEIHDLTEKEDQALQNENPQSLSRQIWDRASKHIHNKLVKDFMTVFEENAVMRANKAIIQKEVNRMLLTQLDQVLSEYDILAMQQRIETLAIDSIHMDNIDRTAQSPIDTSKNRTTINGTSINRITENPINSTAVNMHFLNTSARPMHHGVDELHEFLQNKIHNNLEKHTKDELHQNSKQEISLSGDETIQVSFTGHVRTYLDTQCDITHADMTQSKDLDIRSVKVLPQVSFRDYMDHVNQMRLTYLRPLLTENSLSAFKPFLTGQTIKSQSLKNSSKTEIGSPSENPLKSSLESPLESPLENSAGSPLLTSIKPPIMNSIHASIKNAIKTAIGNTAVNSIKTLTETPTETSIETPTETSIETSRKTSTERAIENLLGTSTNTSLNTSIGTLINTAMKTSANDLLNENTRSQRSPQPVEKSFVQMGDNSAVLSLLSSIRQNKVYENRASVELLTEVEHLTQTKFITESKRLTDSRLLTEVKLNSELKYHTEFSSVITNVAETMHKLVNKQIAMLTPEIAFQLKRGRAKQESIHLGPTNLFVHREQIESGLKTNIIDTLHKTHADILGPVKKRRFTEKISRDILGHIQKSASLDVSERVIDTAETLLSRSLTTLSKVEKTHLTSTITHQALEDVENRRVQPVKMDYAKQASQTAPKVDSRPPDRPMEVIEAPEMLTNTTSRTLPETPITPMQTVDVDAIFEKIYSKFEKRIAFEKRRRGL